MQQMQPLQATPEMCYHCFQVLIEALLENRKPSRLPDFVDDLPDKLVECPLFVTWEKMHNRTWQLRGCIGTLSPKRLDSSVGEYALTSALMDRRFHPIKQSEIRSLRVGVSLLVDYEVCRDVYDWIVGVHGILIKFQVGRNQYSATYLPEVAKEQRWNQDSAVRSLIQKAGYNGEVSKELLRSIGCTRYKSSKYKVSFDEFVTQKCQGQSPLLMENDVSRRRDILAAGCKIS
mmetsp:Transcript_43879/g.105886  ORF Transcript_43879/g.105886 Transcript_43879/m.105886 type:complete len:232 (+) Transcript_43879:114-809(+)|eukprot:CAMPEP_0113629926 /NCGR_PEP_ID=MMETSP0017_2-20120614/15541_1 /TAXON_ID=2856 /ORGANISM="Cylindrotheca closterium" /LENGTH=231 /DNA_ID=CAMNT_0000540355 /DNA_START=74 /DNA_END=769 /DNA_ORIENTATION=+ /assembly_acc=CAM_ASM_000147